MRTIAAALALSLILAGCDSGGGEASKTKSIRPSNPFVDQLKSLSEQNRGLGLRRAVQDSKQRCKKVETSAYQQDYKNLSMWTLRCTDGEYAIFIAPSGDVQVRTCKDVETLGLPECRMSAKAG